MQSVGLIYFIVQIKCNIATWAGLVGYSMKKLFRILVITFLTMPAIVLSDVIAYKEFKGWEIDVYTNKNNQPYSCRGYMPYEGGMRFAIGFTRGSDDEPGLTIRFWSANWRSIEEDKEYEITFEFPRRKPWNLTAQGMASPKDDFFGVRMFYELDDDAINFIQDFRKTTGMKIYVEDNQIGHFSLKGTMGMMSLVTECYQNKVKRRNNDPFQSSSSRNSDDPFDL